MFSQQVTQEGLVQLSMDSLPAVQNLGIKIPDSLLDPKAKEARANVVAPAYAVFGFGRFSRNLPGSSIEASGKSAIAVNVIDGQVIDDFNNQDALYIDAQYGPEGIAELKVMGSFHRGYNIEVRKDAKDVVNFMSKPSFEVAFLTITVHGYYLKKGSSSELNTKHPDLESDTTSESPTTALGIIVKAIEKRRKAGLKPFVVLSCDNADVDPNEILAKYAELVWPKTSSLANYIRQNVRAPVTMVDSVTAGHTRPLALKLANMGVDDRFANAHEEFRAAVAEWPWDEPAPELEHWQFVSRQEAKDIRKAKRILVNALHFAIALIGATTGTRFVHEVTAIPEARKFLNDLFNVYRQTLVTEGRVLGTYGDFNPLERFDIPLNDEVVRVGRNPEAKVTKYITKRMTAANKCGFGIEPFAKLIALWIRWNPASTHPLPNRISFDPDDRDAHSMEEQCRNLLRAVQTGQNEWFEELLESTNGLGRVSTYASKEISEALIRLQQFGPLKSL